MPIIKTTFSEVGIGSYFMMRRGLLWRKTTSTQAVDVWSNRVVQINPDVICHIRK